MDEIKRKKVIRITGIVLIVAGILILAYPLYTNLIMKGQESEILDAWANQVSAGTASGQTSDSALSSESSAGSDESTAAGQNTSAASDTSQDAAVATDNLSPELFILDPNKKVPFKILIPKIGVEWIVHEGTSIASLRKGPGHYPGTVLPGEIGLCVIAGHRTTYGAPFNRVDRLEIGDEIILQTANNDTFTYFVTAKTEVQPNDISILQQPFSYPSLALTTCTPKFYATRRLIVFADMQ